MSRTNRKARLGSLLAASFLLLSACSPPDDGESTSPLTDLSGDEIILTSGLETVDSCDALLERIKDEAVERVGPYGFGQGGFPMVLEAEEMMMEDSATAEAEVSAPATTGAETRASENGNFGGDATDAASDGDFGAGGSGDQEFSETNNQESGVDEADLVKTDGDRMIIVSGDKVRVLDVTGSTPELIDTIALPDNFGGGEMFLDGDSALLMTSGWTERPFGRTGDAGLSWYPGSPTGRLIELNLKTGTVERTLEFEGGYLSAREVDGAIRIVLSATAERFNFVYPSQPGAEDAAETANRQLIEDSTIDQWMPTFRIIEGSGFGGATETSEAGPLVDCDRMFLPSEFAGFGSLVVLTAELDDGLRLNDSVGVFTDAQTVYASTDRLVVATPRWPEFDQSTGQPINDEQYTTALHTFDIEDPRKADYVASGSVLGTLLSQYSLSEHDGYLRVATTVGQWEGRDNSESMVTVLEENGNQLERVGRVDGLGRGEQIFAVRFFGDKGYVVTFRQIDPLYVVDLSDPQNPTVEGELKIPGFSTYLHPIGEDLLLGIGTDGDDDGATFGTVVSLFDVSDPNDPTRVDKLTLDAGLDVGQNGYFESYSNVGDDPRSFTYWAPTDTAIVPFSWFSFDERVGQESNGSAAVLIEVDENSLRETGRISHQGKSECEGFVEFDEEVPPPIEEPDGGFDGDGFDEPSDDEENQDAEADFVNPTTTIAEPAPEPERAPLPPEFCYEYQPTISRSVIIGENLYTISDGGVAVNTFDGLRDVAWIPFN